MCVLISTGAIAEFLSKLTLYRHFMQNFYEQLILLRSFNIQSYYIYSIIRPYTCADNEVKEYKL